MKNKRVDHVHIRTLSWQAMLRIGDVVIGLILGSGSLDARILRAASRDRHGPHRRLEGAPGVTLGELRLGERARGLLQRGGPVRPRRGGP